MESRERVLEWVRQDWGALQYVDDVWRSDHHVILTAVQRDGRALMLASEELRRDPEIVLAAVQEDGSALQHATDTLRADREVVLAAVQQHGRALAYASEGFRGDRQIALAAVQKTAASALEHAADDLLEDPTFATEAKRRFFLLKLTMLSGRSTVLPATALNFDKVEHLLAKCRSRLGLAHDGTTMELWHGSDRVPDDARVKDWPGIEPPGKISEYQLVVTR